MLNAPIEFVSLRAIGTGRTLKATHRRDRSARSAARHGVRHPSGSERSGSTVDRDGRQDVDVHDGDDLHPGQTLRGPALIDGTDTTVWVPETTSLRVEPARNPRPGGWNVKTVDPITLEVLRSRLEAIGEEAGAALEPHRDQPGRHRVEGLLLHAARRRRSCRRRCGTDRVPLRRRVARGAVDPRAPPRHDCAARRRSSPTIRTTVAACTRRT